VRRLLPFIVAICSTFLIGTPLSAAAEGGGANHVVLATTTADGSSLERSGLQVGHAGGPTVASSNIAAALSYACTGCNSVAVAFQAVLVTGDPNTVVPANAAVATNVACTSCTAYAFAYQYVLSTDGPVPLREEIRGLAESDLPPDVLTQQLDAVAADFKATIDEELIAAGKPVDGVEKRQVEAISAP
jgi:hypothetical protein